MSTSGRKLTKLGRLRKVAASFCYFEFIEYSDVLKKIVEEMRRYYESYSWKDMAEDLDGSSHNRYYQIASHRKVLKEEEALKLVNKLKLVKERKKWFLMLVQYRNASKRLAKEKIYENLLSYRKSFIQDPEKLFQFEYYSDWVYPVIKEMHSLHPNLSLEEKLNLLNFKLEKSRVNEIIDQLKKHNLLDLKPTNNKPSAKMLDLISKNYQRKIFELSNQLLETLEMDEMDVNSVVVSMDQDSFKKLEKILVEACHAALDLEKTAKKDFLVQMNTQIFKISKER